MSKKISCLIIFCAIKIIALPVQSYGAIGENIPFLKAMIINQMYDYAVQVSEVQQQVTRYTQLLAIPDVFTREYLDAKERVNDIMDVSNTLVDELLLMRDVVVNQVDDFTQKGYEFLSEQLDEYSRTLQTARDAFQSWSVAHLRVDNDAIATLDTVLNEANSVIAHTQVTNYSLAIISNQLQQLTEIMLMSEKIRIAEQSEKYMKEIQTKKEEQRIIDNFWNGNTAYSSYDSLVNGIYD